MHADHKVELKTRIPQPRENLHHYRHGGDNKDTCTHDERRAKSSQVCTLPELSPSVRESLHG
jgi:hypothetical protein